MINLSKQRWLIVSVIHYITLFFVAQANHYLTPVGLNALVVGMLVSFSAMELSFKQGLLSLVPIALYLDSKSPLPFGFSLALFLLLFTLAYIIRSQVRREITASALASSIMLNLTAFLAYTLATAWHLGTEGLSFGVLALNLSLSAVVVALVNSLFFQAQTDTLAFFGVNLAEEQRATR